jgi:hypothetical protein
MKIEAKTAKRNPGRLQRLVRRLDGYQVAAIKIETILDEAKLKCPKRLLWINRKSAAYRAGVYDAILTAHCLMALGEFPEHNKEQIANAMKSPNEKS